MPRAPRDAAKKPSVQDIPLPVYVMKPPRVIDILAFEKPVPKNSLSFNPLSKKPGAWLPEEVRMAERALQERVAAIMEREGLTEPYLGPVRIEAVWQVCTDLQETLWFQDNAALNYENIHPLRKPDCTNLMKLAEDAIKGVKGLFLDDEQVVSQLQCKRYGPSDCFWIRVHLEDLDPATHGAQINKRLQAWRMEIMRPRKKAAKKRVVVMERQAKQEEERQKQRQRLEVLKEDMRKGDWACQCGNIAYNQPRPEACNRCGKDVWSSLPTVTIPKLEATGSQVPGEAIAVSQLTFLPDQCSCGHMRTAHTVGKDRKICAIRGCGCMEFKEAMAHV